MREHANAFLRDGTPEGHGTEARSAGPVLLQHRARPQAPLQLHEVVGDAGGEGGERDQGAEQEHAHRGLVAQDL